MTLAREPRRTDAERLPQRGLTARVRLQRGGDIAAGGMGVQHQTPAWLPQRRELDRGAWREPEPVDTRCADEQGMTVEPRVGQCGAGTARQRLQ